MCNKECLVLAGIGGTMPTVCKLAATYVTNPRTPLPELNLLFGLGLFFLIGAVLAYAFTEDDLRKAFVLGIAAPGIITNIFAGASPPDHVTPQKQTIQQSIFEYSYLSDAFAAESNKNRANEKHQLGEAVVKGAGGTGGVGGLSSSGTVTVKRRKMFIMLESNLSGITSDSSFQIFAKLNDGKDIKIAAYSVTSNYFNSFSVPANTKYIELKCKGVIARLDISQDKVEPITIEANFIYKPKNDFLWALGFKREMFLESIKLKSSHPKYLIDDSGSVITDGKGNPLTY